MRIVSCNPAELKDPDVPPTFSGYATADRTGWPGYWDEYGRVHADLHADFDAFCRERGAPPLPELEFVHSSPWLNLWIYPDEVDYRARPPARLELAQPPVERPHHRRALRAASAATSPSSTSASARSPPATSS